jgi:hypothetical protein
VAAETATEEGVKEAVATATEAGERVAGAMVMAAEERGVGKGGKGGRSGGGERRLEMIAATPRSVICNVPIVISS